KNDKSTCEKTFNVTYCNDCQKLIFHDLTQEDNDCATSFVLIKEIAKEVKELDKDIDIYNLTYFKKGLKNYCDQQFNCDLHTAEKYWTEIEQVCVKELSDKIDLNGDPKKVDKTVLMTYGTLFTYYFGIPEHKALCYKSSDSDEFCVVDLLEKLMNYVKEVTDADPKPTLSMNFNYIIKKDGTKVPIPKKIFCGEKCLEYISKMYISWVKEYKLSPEIIENLYGSEDEMIDNMSCKYEDKRGIIRRTSDLYLTPFRSYFLK
ncbi:316_t:CDS:2, partial [Scutellospora calospora]